MRNVLIFDCETTGLDRQSGRIIEIGYCLWSVEYRGIVECYSSLLPCEGNEAQAFNGISTELLLTAPIADAYPLVMSLVLDAAQRADAVVAHQADFDREFAEHEGFAFAGRPWICTREDLEWPGELTTRHLVNIALAHGVAVTSAHRAIHDVLLLTRLFERVPDIDQRLEAALVLAQRPKAHFIAQIGFEQNDEVKKRGFRWNGNCWSRYMAVEDAVTLPFTAVQEQPSG